MENKNENIAGAKPVKKYLGIGFGVLILVIVVIFGYPKYQDWKFNKELKELAEEINKPYLEDVYGGKTPKETLEMFISAIEKEDFELASKYFVLEKQEEWMERLVKGKESGKLNNLLELIIEEVDKLNRADPIWEYGDRYISDSQVLFEFIKYPQGIWKIQEI